MPDDPSAQDTRRESVLDELRSRTDLLEASLSELRTQSEARLIRAEMKAEAIRAGMIDLDCLQFVDLSSIKLNERGEAAEAPLLIAQLKKLKPWMFITPSSSSLTPPPSAQPTRQKHAMEMTDAEYAAARAALLKHHF